MKYVGRDEIVRDIGAYLRFVKKRPVTAAVCTTEFEFKERERGGKNNITNTTLAVKAAKVGAYVHAGRLVGRSGVCDHRIVEGSGQNGLHVLADGRLAGGELDEHVKRMRVGHRTRQAQLVFHVPYGRVVH